MDEQKSTYYLIYGRVVAKRERESSLYKGYIFRDGKWTEDSSNVVMDHLMGFDSSEPEDSPYRIGNTSVLFEMDEITEDQAISLINQQLLDFLKKKWKSDFKEAKAQWDKSPMWPSKCVETEFVINGVKCSMLPPDLGLTYDCWDQGFMESIQEEICRDLKEYGAINIRKFGFID